MSCIQIHKGDIGTAFTVTVTNDDGEALNISSATESMIIFMKPNGTAVSKTATFVTDGSDGQIRYISEDGFLDVVGKWSLQSYITTPSGAWYSDIDTFKVIRNLE